MKQTVLMLALTLVGTLGVFVGGPFVALAVYYLFAVLRPQFIWAWALPAEIPWSQFVGVSAIVSCGLYLLGIGRDPGDPPLLGISRTQKLYLAFGGWVCLSYVTAQNQTVAGIYLLEYLKIFTVFIVGILVIRHQWQIWTLYLLATTSLIYIALEVNVTYLSEGRIDIYYNGYGGLDNNGAGLMLAMGVPLAVYAWETSRKWWRWAFAAGVPVLVHAVMMTYSRGAMLSLVVAALPITFRSRRRRQFAMMAIVMAFAIPVMAGREIRARFFTISDYESDASANSRFGSWGAGVRIANEHPILGVGIRNSDLFSLSHGADVENRAIHSQYIQTLADSGYPALMLYLCALAHLFWTMARARRALRGAPSSEKAAAMSMLAGIESSAVVFACGAAFLSLEVFELPYLVALMGSQLSFLVLQGPVAQAPDPSLGAVSQFGSVSQHLGPRARASP